MERNTLHNATGFQGREWLYLVLCLLFLYGASAFYLFQWPIVAVDTDLWYHLNGGRYIVEHHVLPTDSSFFSFIAPPRAWVDYYWLFQVFVYRIHTAFGYPGLIVLRNAAYGALVTAILSYFYLARRRGSNNTSLYLAALFALYMLFLLARYTLVRPHIFSYLFIVVFLLIYEYAPRRAIWLPLVAILWCNLHGAEYPIMLLISGAYVVEYIVNRLKTNRTTTGADLVFLMSAALSMWAIFATPHGVKLLTIPFSTAHASQYIAEYRPLTPQSLATVNVTALIPSQRVFFTLLMAAMGSGVIVSGLRRKLRVSHLLMFAGGIVLLVKGSRFMYECALLVLPILATSGPIHASNPHTRMATPRTIFAAILLIVAPFLWLRSTFANPPQFPVSYRGLPQGVVTFLKHVRTPGSVLNHPNTGGYLQWMLSPTNKIFMDMQCPLLFTEEDLYTAINMYSSEEVLRKVLARYDPAFLSVPISNDRFGTLIQEFQNYVLVFFDDAEVLYVNQRRYPAIAQQYELNALDPFRLAREGAVPYLSNADPHTLLRDAHQLLVIYPHSLLLNQLVAVSFNMAGAYDRTLMFAETIIQDFPESATGYALKGDALQGLKAFDRALVFYHRALGKAGKATKPEIYRAMGEAYLAAGQAGNAYRVFKKIVYPFSPSATPEELFLLGSSAFLAGHSEEGTMILRFAAQKVSPKDATWYERLKELERSIVHVKAQ